MESQMITEEQLTSNIKNTSYENSHPNEIAQTILNREKDTSFISNNSSVCYICQKEISVNYIQTFSCNHLICIPCISKLILRQNFNFFENKFQEKNSINILINCICNKGNFSLNHILMERKLNDAMMLNKSKDIICYKHFQVVTNYCSNCNIEICNKCLDEHNKEIKKNKKNKNHNIVKLEKCYKSKKYFPKEKINDIEEAILNTKKKIDEFANNEKNILINEIEKIINNLNDIKNNYINSFNEKTNFINKILDFIYSTYKLFYKECDYNIEEISLKNYRLIETISNTFKQIEFIPKSSNYIEKLLKELEKISNTKSLLDFEYKLKFKYKTFSKNQLLIGHKNSVNCLSPFQDKYIASGSSDHTINIYDCSSDDIKIKPIKQLSFHVDSVESILDIDNGNQIISSGRDDKLCIWDTKEILDNLDEDFINTNSLYMEQNQNTKKILPKKYIFTESVEVYNLHLLSNGEIAVLGRDGTIKLVEKNLKKIKKIFMNNYGPVLSMDEFDECTLIIGGANSNIKLYDINKRKIICSYIFDKDECRINCITKLKKDKNAFITGGSDKIIRILKYEKNNKYTELKINDFDKLVGHEGDIYCVIELFDGRIASGSADLNVKIWDLNNKICMQTLEGHRNAVICLAQLNDGRLISGCADEYIYLWK